MSTATPPAPTSLAQPVAPPGPRSPLRTAITVRRPSRSGDTVVLVPVLVLTAVLLRLGLDGAPGRLESEGQLVTRAYDVTHVGPVGDPSAGSSLSALLIAAWDAATGALSRGTSAVGAGRELMVLLTLLSAALLWALARRMGLPRAAAALALLLFATVPLAVQAHRAALPGNLALPWLLAAFVLVMSPGRRIGAFVAASTCFAVAAVVSPAAVLVLPALGWLLLRRAEPSTRSYVVGVASAPALLAALVVAVGAGAGLSPEQTGGVWSTSWPFAGGRLAGTPWVVVVALAAATGLALVIGRWRPIGVAAVLLMLGVVVSGTLLSSLVTLTAVGALVVAAAATEVWRRRPHDSGRAITTVAAAAGLVVAGLSVPGWARELSSIARSDTNAPSNDAVGWLSRNVPATDAVVVDDVLWVDVARQGREPARVVRLGRAHGDLAAATRSDAAAPVSWLVSTDAIRRDPARVALLRSLAPRTSVAAAWGTGAARVEVRRVEGGGAADIKPAAEPAPTSTPTPTTASSPQRAAAARAGQELSRNPHLTLDAPARAALVSGDVDPRLLVVLSLAAAVTDVGVSSFTATGGGSTLDQMDLVTVDDTPGSTGSDAVDRLRALLEAQPDAYRPQITQRTPYAGTDVLTISVPAAL